MSPGPGPARQAAPPGEGLAGVESERRGRDAVGDADAHAALHEALAALGREPGRFDAMQALRLLERAHAGAPRLGSARRRRDDALRLSVAPSLAATATAVADFHPGQAGAPARLVLGIAGLAGAGGPLPLHVTERLHARLRHAGDAAPMRFLDLFHHRLLTLLYRAWAEAQPTVSLDRPHDDAFGARLAALAGGVCPEGGAVPLAGVQGGAGLLSRGVRHAEGLEQWLTYLLGVPAAVRAWTPRWTALPPESCCRLGADGPAAQLGAGAMLGRQVWEAQGQAEVVLGPLTRAEQARLLPGGTGLALLRDAARHWSGLELAWRVRLVLRHDEVPAPRLGSPAVRLGWSAWLGQRGADAGDAVDAVLDA